MGFTDFMGKVGGAIGDAVDAVGDAVGDAVDAVGDAAGAVVDAVGDIASDVFTSLGDVVGALLPGGSVSPGMIAVPPRRSPLPPGLEYDPPSITQPENWQAYSHQEIYSINQRSLDEGKTAAVADGWREIAESLREVGETLQRDATSAIEGGWEGEAADRASDSVRPVVEWTQLTSEAFDVIGSRLQEAGEAAGQAKEAVPEPEGHSIGRTLTATVLGGPIGAGVDALLQMRNRQEAERGAQDAMARLLTPAYLGVDQSVPTLPGLDGGPASPPRVDPDVVIDPPPPPVGIGGPSPAPATPFHVDPDGSGDRNDPSGKPTPAPDDKGGTSKKPTTPPPSTDPSWVPDRPPGGGVGVPAPAGPGPGPGGREGAPGGVVPPGAWGAGGGAGAGAGGAGGAGVGRAGGAAAGRAGGFGGGAGGAGAGALGPGGRAGVGAPGGAGGGAGGAAAGAGAASATGRGGMMGAGMGAGAARGAQGGDDQEHDRPSWLEENDDVWLDDMPKTAPPVFGA